MKKIPFAALFILGFVVSCFAGSYTPNLNLYMPAVNELGWGPSVANNFSILDSIVGHTFGPSGQYHSIGLVPDPGASSGSVRYLREDGTWVTPAGGGNVTSSGTPTLYQWGVWTASTNIKGVSVTASSIVKTDSNGQPAAATAFVDYMPGAGLTSISGSGLLASLTSANFVNGVTTINCTAACTLPFPAAATVTPGVRQAFVTTGAGAVTLSLTAANWWNTALVGSSVVMGAKTEIWTDGTYWYASPIDVAISDIVVLSGGSATTLTPITLTGVPLSAKRVWGSLYQNSTVGYLMASSSGSDRVQISSPSSSPMLVPFGPMAITTPGTLYYLNNVAGGVLGVTISGFGF